MTTTGARKAISGDADKANGRLAQRSKPAAKKRASESPLLAKRRERTQGGSRSEGERTALRRKPPASSWSSPASEAEGVTGLERTDDGWKVQVEVVEVRRIPDTTDVLALYEVEVDEHGELEGYRRVRRYTRGAGGEY